LIDTIPIPSGWPKMSLAEVNARLTAPGSRFEMEEVEIRGIRTRVWKNAPPSLPALVRFSRLHGDRLATVFEEERVTYEMQYRAVAALAAEPSPSRSTPGGRARSFPTDYRTPAPSC
jgi:long-chain acyl-CoA synthetase